MDESWLIAGLESQLKNPGDFITCDIGPESILCTKDKEGQIRAFYNVCQHRGNILMHEEKGNEKFLSCKYHGWMFTHDGELARVPAPEDFPQGNPCGKLRLVEIPCETLPALSGIPWMKTSSLWMNIWVRSKSRANVIICIS